MKSIQSKILTVVISGLIVITTVVSTIAVNMTHEIMHKDADRILNNVTQKEAAYINDVLGDIKKSATIMEHYAKGEIEQLSQLKDLQFRSKYLEKTNKMFLEIALNTSGVEGFFFRLNPEYSNSTAGYYNLLTDDLKVKQMPVTDLSKYHKDDAKNVGWYYTPVKEGKAVWLEPYLFPGYDKQLISYTIPLYIDNELLGVIGFDMDFGYLVNRIKNISVYQKGYAVLVAKDKQTVYTNAERIESKDPHTKASVELQNGMYLELRADYKDIQHDIHPMLSKIVFAFIVVMILSIFYTIVVTHKIVRPLKKLTSVAKELSLGTNKVSINEISVESKDEIGTLSRVLKNSYEKIDEYTKHINELAYMDSLTKIQNSTAYAEAITEINNEIESSNPSFGVVVADINNLKQTNDKFGHDIGNKLIIHTAKILTDIFKSSSVFRIGGDEFAIILKDEDYKNYATLLENLDKACKDDYIIVDQNKIPVSIARGVAVFNPEFDKSYEEIFAKADQRMYSNKQEQKLLLV